MLLFVVVAVPLEPARNFWKGKRLTGLTKGIFLAVLFCVSVGLVPTADKGENAISVDQQSAQQSEDGNTPDISNDIDRTVFSESEPTLAVEPDEEPEPVSTIASEPEPEPEPTSQPSSQLSESTVEEETHGTGNADNFNTYDNEEQQETTSSYVLNTSTKKIHYPSCSQVKKIAPQNYATSDVSEEELKSQGYTVCGVCH